METLDPAADNPDSILLQRAIDGDDQAFTLLVQRYQKSLYDFVWRQLGNHADTADICQKAFIQVFLKAKDYRGEAKFQTWLFQIAINLCKNLYRSNDRQRLDDVDIEESIECNAEQTVEQFQNQKLLRNAIKRLPERQRITLELKIYRDFTFSEIAETLQCSVGGVKANYHHALVAIKNLLADTFHEDN